MSAARFNLIDISDQKEAKKIILKNVPLDKEKLNFGDALDLMEVNYHIVSTKDNNVYICNVPYFLANKRKLSQAQNF